jgi:hypothetical protein
MTISFLAISNLLTLFCSCLKTKTDILF